MTKERYKSGRHLPRVKRAAKVRLGAYLVLSALCDRSSYKRPEVTITKRQIANITGLERKAIQRGLSLLRERGVITAIEGLDGGRGMAVTYRLNIVGEDQGAGQTPDKVRKCPPQWTASWHKDRGIDYAMDRKRRYEAGEDFEDE
jgi:DNA-binding transcriptional ArsR family regulator